MFDALLTSKKIMTPILVGPNFQGKNLSKISGLIYEYIWYLEFDTCVTLCGITVTEYNIVGG